jgi:nucleoid-associated protein YgaU
MIKYQVIHGDTLFAVAGRFYGDPELYPVIAIANGLTDPDVIAVGQELLVPYVTYRHTVSPDDTLPGLAQHFFGDAALYPIIISANRIADPDAIGVGQVLLIPDLQNVSHHTVYPGDTLYEYAARWYGDSDLWPVIAVANRLVDPNLIRVGDVLTRPGLNRRHTVQAGETLTSLAQWYLGDAGAAPLIAATNKLPEPATVRAGQVLTFPDLF